MKIGKSQKTRGASILLLSFLFMAVLFLLASALYKIVPAEMHAATRSSIDMRGHYVARAGIESTINWLNYQVDQFAKSGLEEELPDYTLNGTTYPNRDAFLANGLFQDFDDGNWRYELKIIPHQDTLSLTNNSESRFFSVSSTSYYKDKPIRRMDALLRQKTFALLGFYTDKVDPNSSMVIPSGNGGIRGPVHTNDYWRFDVAPDAWNGRDEPYFKSTVGYARGWSGAPAAAKGDGSEWVSGAPYDGGDIDEVNDRYAAIFHNGREGLRTKNEIKLPSSSISVKARVWPESDLPDTKGVFLHKNEYDAVDGGILVLGDINELNLKLDQYGNQETVIKQTRPHGTTTRSYYKSVPYDPPRYETRTRCKRYDYIPQEGSGGSGVSGGKLPDVAVCAEYEEYEVQVMQSVLDRTEEVESTAVFTTTVVEVVENDVTYTDVDGAQQVARVGETLLIDKVGNEILTAEVIKGQPNGAYYVEGNIGTRTTLATTSNSSNSIGLWGITKGSVQTDNDGEPITDSDGNYQYNNKMVATNLNNSINLGGDLLQFDQEKFNQLVKQGGLNPSTHANAAKVARDPNRHVLSGDPHDVELSPSADHAMGIWTKDVWMKGPKSSSMRNNNDGVNDVYAIILAGKTEVDASGEPLLQSGREVTSGGFGTWYSDRNATGRGLGKFRIFGGIIQATTGNNYRESTSYTHYWVTGGVGFDVEEINYDIEATKIPFFPPLSEFSIVRFIETSARGT